MWPVAVTVVCLVAIGVGGFLYFTKLELREQCPRIGASQQCRAGCTAPTIGRRTAGYAGRSRPSRRRLVTRASIGRTVFGRNRAVRPRPHPRCCSPTNMSPRPSPRPLALNLNGMIGLASSAAERRSRKKRGARTVPEARRCRSFAAEMRDLCGRQCGDLSAWPAAVAAVAVDQARSFDREAVRASGMPFMRDQASDRLESNYVPGKKSKAIAVGPGRQ